jgi:serine/threonine-protein kinase
MEPAPRYEILDTIATGDFAVVYRARDRELGREVAIKQIHQQFLHDERQLARYWQEAQLLASLQHPNILTIYDIVRSRGWLIVELMRGNLHAMARGEPIDLDYLRTTLAGCLSALHFLHTNGVIHGDVKPTNMLVDAQNRVKLGDFGLARRASNEEGSLLKGTTKYMAPELVAQQFGAIGPASDLYSLGFSAYELMCGAQFDSLFPGLSSFGRDRQIAWMMWHAAPDRHLPEITRVLQGVPDDLARVVQRMVAKDQSQRYKSAGEALRDLRTDATMAPPPAPEEDALTMEAQAAAARRKLRTRFMAIGALAMSLMVTLAVLFWPEKEIPPPPEPVTVTGVIVRNNYSQARELQIRMGEGQEKGKLKAIPLTPGDTVYLNHEKRDFADLREGDEVKITIDLVTKKNEIRAARADTSRGAVETVRADEGYFTLKKEDGAKDPLRINVSAEVKIRLNDRALFQGRAMKLADLKPGDRIAAAYIPDDVLGQYKAKTLDVTREVEIRGIVRLIDGKQRKLTLEVEVGGKPTNIVLPFAPDCVVVINDQAVKDAKPLRPTDLQPGDEALKVLHDTLVRRVEAKHVGGDKGAIVKVDDSPTMGMLQVKPDAGEAVAYKVGANCTITLGGEAVTLGELREGDTVEIQHGSIGSDRIREALHVAAQRGSDPNRWAILVGNQTFDDATVAKLAAPVEDVKLLADVLAKRYRVPPAQVVTFMDESRVRLVQGIPERLKSMSADAQVLLYFAGHAFKDAKGTVYLAPKDFVMTDMPRVGLTLQWLVDEFEACPAKEKLLLLDCQTGDGADPAKEPAAADALRSLKAPAGRAPLRTLHAVASYKTGERGQALADKGHGLFAWCLSEAYQGKADKNRDLRLEPTELFTYLNETMSAAKGTKGPQTPELFLPDARPPRLTDDAKKAIRALAAHLQQDKPNLKEGEQAFAAAVDLSKTEPEAKLLWGMMLLKGRKSDDAIKFFGTVRSEHPHALLPIQGSVWARFQKRSYKPAMEELNELITKIPKLAAGEEKYPEESRWMFYWAGQLREFAGALVAEAGQPPPPPADLLTALDAAVADHGAAAQNDYQLGRDKTKKKVADMDKRIASGEAGGDMLKINRRLVITFTDFPFAPAIKKILGGLDE